MRRRPPSIRLTRATEDDLAAIGELLRGDHPIPTTRSDALRNALAFARTYMEGYSTAGQALPSVEQLQGISRTRGDSPPFLPCDDLERHLAPLVSRIGGEAADGSRGARRTFRLSHRPAGERTFDTWAARRPPRSPRPANHRGCAARVRGLAPKRPSE